MPAPRGAIKVAACVRRASAAEAAHRPVLEFAAVTLQGVDVPIGITVEIEAGGQVLERRDSLLGLNRPGAADTKQALQERATENLR